MEAIDGIKANLAILHSAGARAIVAADPVAFKRDTALALGATHAVDPGSDDVAGLVRELTEGRGADYAFDTAGAPGVVAQAYEAVRRGGIVVAARRRDR